MYCLVKNGKIKETVSKLPKKFGNVACAFDKKTNQELKEYGWVPLIKREPPVLKDWERKTRVTAIDVDKVEETYLVEDIPLEKYKKIKVALLKDKYRESINAGYKSSLGFTTQIRDSDQSSWQATLLMIEYDSSVTEVEVEDINNDHHFISHTDYKKLYNEMLKYKISLKKNFWHNRRLINNAEDYEAVLNIYQGVLDG